MDDYAFFLCHQILSSHEEIVKLCCYDLWDITRRVCDHWADHWSESVLSHVKNINSINIIHGFDIA